MHYNSHYMVLLRMSAVANLGDEMLCIQDLHARTVHVPVWVQRVHLPLAIAALQPAFTVPHQLNHCARS